jgi:hypothetical protein
VPSPYLRIYLQDHHATLTAGVGLAGRVAAANRDAPNGPLLAAVSEHLRDERRALEETMGRLGIARQPFKEVAALGAERLGRLKLNGEPPWGSYSPLSRLVELEGLALMVGRTGLLWRVLDTAGVDPAGEPWADRVEQAEAVGARLEALVAAAARAALGPGG